MKRIVFVSGETAKVAKQSKNGIVKVYGFFPVDRAGCECQKMVIEWKRKLGQASDPERKRLLAETPYLVCPRSKQGLHRFTVICRKCGEIQGYCWATDKSLMDWCDFHYIQWTYGDYWRGCLTPHISPITQKLLFECACGQDTRDFRANMTRPQKVAERIESMNAKGRELGRPDSKFVIKQVKVNVIP